MAPLSDVVNGDTYVDPEGVERTATGRLVIRPQTTANQGTPLADVTDGGLPTGYQPNTPSPYGAAKAVQGGDQNTGGDLISMITQLKDRLLGTGGQERYQTWPEKMVREGVSAPAVLSQPNPYQPGTEEYVDFENQRQDYMVPGALATASLAGGGALTERPGAATLGSGPVRRAPVAEAPAVSPSPFYSALEHAAINAKQDTMAPDQWLGYLKNQPGVKGEEMDWTGLGDWLGQQKSKVSKADVQRYLDEHKVEVKDVTKHEGGLTGLENDRFTIEEHHGRHRIVDNDQSAVVDTFPTRQEAEDALTRYADDPEFARQYGDAKYSDYQLPGGENYREHLLTLPQKIGDPTGATRFLRGELNGDPAKFGFDTPEKVVAEAQRRGYVGGKDDKAGPTYRSSHWDEPNILAHVRTNDRVFPGETLPATGKPRTINDVIAARDARAKELGYHGQTNFDVHKLWNDPQYAKLDNDWRTLAQQPKGSTLPPDETVPQPVQSLHLEEIQSDWHQEGRKKGYKDPEAVQKARDTAAASQQAFEDHLAQDKNLDYRTIGNIKMQVASSSDAGERPMIMGQLERMYGPKARELGEQFAKDLDARHRAMEASVPDAPFKTSWPELALKRMVRMAAEEGKTRISWTPGEAQAARYDLSKQVDKVQYNKDSGQLLGFKDGRQIVHQTVKPDELDSAIGKEAANKLLNEPTRKAGSTHELSGEGLKVGGEGMKGFYDNMLPKMAEKLGKPYGVKVKKGEMPGGEPPRNPRGVFDILAEHEPEFKTQFPTIKDFVDYWNDAGNKHRTELTNRATSYQKSPIWYFDIPEKMRDAALSKGFPMFSQAFPFPLVPVDHNPFEKKERR